MKSSWRYVHKDTWSMDKIINAENPEDKWISDMDGVPTKVDTFDAYEVLNTLTAREAKIVEMVCYNNITFNQAGKNLTPPLCKQRVYQIYRAALQKLKLTVPNAS